MNELELCRWLIAEIEHRDNPTDEDVQTLDGLLERAEAIIVADREARERAERVAAVERAAQDPANLERAVPEFNVSETSTRDLFDLSDVRWMDRERAVPDLRARARESVESHSRADDDAKEAAVRLLERRDTRNGDLSIHYLVHGSPAYERGWSKAMLSEKPTWTAEESAAMERAMSIGTNTAGGFMVPTLLDPTIILTNAGTINPIRAISTVKQVTGDNWNGVSSAGVTASWDAEAAEVSDDSPTLAQPSIAVHKAAAFVPFSIEAGEDISNLSSEVAMLFADAKNRLEATAFTTGSGSGQPFGIVTAVAAVTASRVAATTNNTFGLVDVYATLEGCPARHRAAASWCANLNIINDIRQFATANNYHGFLTDLAGDTPRQLLGKPLYEVSDMDGAIATGNDDILLIGDFSRYVIVDRIGFSVELVPHLFHTSTNRPSGSRGWYGHWRAGADTVDVNAFRILRV